MLDHVGDIETLIKNKKSDRMTKKDSPRPANKPRPSAECRKRSQRYHQNKKPGINNMLPWRLLYTDARPKCEGAVPALKSR